MAKRHQRVMRLGRLIRGPDGTLGKLAAQANHHRVIAKRLRRVLGLPLADHVSLGSLTPQRLVLVTDSPVWSSRLRYQGKALLASFSDYLESQELSRLEIKVAPIAVEPSRPLPPPNQVSSDAAAHLESVADSLAGQERLQATLRRLARRSKRR